MQRGPLVLSVYNFRRYLYVRATIAPLDASHCLELKSCLAHENLERERRPQMFLILAVVLVVLWLGGFTLMHVSSLLIHLLLIFAVISVILHFVTGGSKSA
jgi:Family of unknown function (DUF5670)